MALGFQIDLSRFHLAEEETDMCVRDRALFYYRLLRCGVVETRQVLGGPKSDPSLGLIAGRPEEAINNWAAHFNTLEPVSSSGSVVAGIGCDGVALPTLGDSDGTAHSAANCTLAGGF